MSGILADIQLSFQDAVCSDVVGLIHIRMEHLAFRREYFAPA